jgi:hypothetical protein
VSAVYSINKGVNRTLEFKGIKAQYILFLAAGLVLLLLLFAILYLGGCNTYLLIGIILPAGAGLFYVTAQMSKKYGEHGLVKKIAKKQLPGCVKSRTSKTFFLSGK